MLLAVAGSMNAQSVGAEMPQAGFTSTGTMMGSGSAYSSTPTISDNGTASNPYGSRPGARKDATGTGTIDMPDDDDDDDPNPIGEPLVMLLFAAAAAAVVALRRRKAQA